MDGPVGAIPHEILELCDRKGSLEVVGRSGSGKTVFCLTLLCLLAQRGRRVTYMSTRIPMKSVFSTYPVCGEITGGTFVDITNVVRRSAEENIEHVELGDIADFAVFMADRVGTDFILAIDPWDGLAEKDGRPLVDVERAMAEVINQMGCSVILSREKKEEGPLVHSVDAQITLDSLDVEGESVRQMRIEKMRGFEMLRREHLYTLKGGRFCVTDTLGFSTGGFELRVVDLPKPMEEDGTHFPSGIQEFDEITGGGFAGGSYVTFETDRETPSSLVEVLCYPLMADFLLKGRGVMVIPAGARDAAAELSVVKGMFDDAQWEKVRQKYLARGLRIVEFGRGEPSDPDCSVSAPGEDLEEEYKSWLGLRKELRDAGKSPVLSIASYDTIESMYGREPALRIAGANASLIRRDKGLHISIVSADLAVRDRLIAVSDYYLRTKLIDNTVLFWGIKPKTGVHALSIEDPGSFRRIRLVPMA